MGSSSLPPLSITTSLLYRNLSRAGEWDLSAWGIDMGVGGMWFAVSHILSDLENSAEAIEAHCPPKGKMSEQCLPVGWGEYWGSKRCL